MIHLYATLGPRCHEKSTLVSMFQEGMSGVRLNLSHMSLKESETWIKNVFDAGYEVGVKPELIIDLQGPELRIGDLREPVNLREKEEVLLGCGGIAVPDVLFSAVKTGQEILLDDGKLLLRIKNVKKDQMTCEVIRGGTLFQKKSIALMECNIELPAVTQIDEKNLACAVEMGVTGILQPFVRGKKDLLEVRKAMGRAGCPDLEIFAKIEDMDGVRKIDEIISNCDKVVIARGDLGNAMPLWNLPRIQKEISRKCTKEGKSVMVATQLLASMQQSEVPTRAEVSDVFNAVLDGADSLIVTGETASGRYPVSVIRYLKKTCEQAEQYKKEVMDIIND